MAFVLVERSGEVRFEKGSRLAAIYGVDAATEEYHCRYGLSSVYSDRLTSGPLRVSGRNAAGEVRAIGLLLQPINRRSNTHCSCSIDRGPRFVPRLM